MRQERPEEERDGQEPGAGWGGDWGGQVDGREPGCGEWKRGVRDRVKTRPMDQGKEESMAKRGRRTRGMAGGGTKREGEAGKEPPRTKRPH